MAKDKKDVLILHNIISPYRLPLFEKLNDIFDITVYFCKTKTQDRKWKTSLEEYSFNWKVLKEFSIGIFFINPLLIFKLLKDKKDVYIVGENPSNLFSTLATIIISKIYQKPLIIWSEAIEEDYRDKNTIQKIMDKICDKYRKLLYSQADSLIGYGEKPKQYLIRRGVNPEKIYSGIQVMPEELLREPEKKNKDKKTILYLGYLNERKGVRYLIEAYKSLEDRKDWKLLIAGSGPAKSNLEKIAGEEKDINFLGYVSEEEKADYYSKADIFVLPTLQDPWGLVVNEAMYYGCPIITTEAAGASQIVQKADNGIIVEPKNQKELREALDKLIKDEELRRKMSENSKKFKEAQDVEEGIKPFKKAIEDSK